MIQLAGCKINLGLYISGKRSDGYHTIESLLFPVPWHDIIEIVPSEKFEFSFSGLKIDGDEESNLVVKAFRLLQKYHSIGNVKIHLHKTIPFGAGLGGGSSDAVSTITLLNKIFNLGLSESQLTEYASQLGSDCPFFVNNSPAIAIGTGTTLQDYSLNLSGYYLLIIKPQINISTVKAYSLIKKYSMPSLLEDALKLPINQWKDELNNDFLNPMKELFPQLSDYINALYQMGAIYANMSGSGSSVFGIFKQKPSAEFDFKSIFKIIKL